jgi:hypothetical protein
MRHDISEMVVGHLSGFLQMPICVHPCSSVVLIKRQHRPDAPHALADSLLFHDLEAA